MKRITLSGAGTYFAVLLTALSLIATVYFANKFWGSQSPEFANAFTGAGAVLAASISALVAFRSISIVEEAHKPYPYPYIDTQSRYGLSLLKLKNAGGSAAHQVYIQWDESVPKLRQPNGQVEAQPLNFAGDESHAIAVLMPGDEQSTLLGVHHWVAHQLKSLDKELKGQVVYRDIKGHLHYQRFFIDTSCFQWSLADETELLKAQNAMTMIPDALNRINKSLQQIKDHKKS